MTALQLIFFAVRLFAIWLALNLFGYVSAVTTVLWRGATQPGEAVMAVSALVATSSAALYLWLFPMSVARHLLPDPSGADAETRTSPEEWFLLGCRLMGLWVLCASIPSLLFQLAYLYQVSNRDADRLFNAPTRWSAARLAVESLIALWLLFGAKGLLGLLRMARKESRPSQNLFLPDPLHLFVEIRRGQALILPFSSSSPTAREREKGNGNA